MRQYVFHDFESVEPDWTLEISSTSEIQSHYVCKIFALLHFVGYKIQIKYSTKEYSATLSTNYFQSSREFRLIDIYTRLRPKKNKKIKQLKFTVSRL